MRDGEQRPGLALSIEQKLEIALIMDDLGIFQIEAGTPAMGGDEMAAVCKISKLGLSSRISAWNRMKREDIMCSMDCGVDIIHISVPSSDLHINKKLGKDRPWIEGHMIACIKFIVENKFKASVGFEDASRADISFLKHLASSARDEGAEMIRYADTLGILTPAKSENIIGTLKRSINAPLQFHGHNDFGMAAANSLAAAKGGADYIDCTFGGLGERSGNCNIIHFMKSYSKVFGINAPVEGFINAEKKILDIFMKPK